MRQPRVCGSTAVGSGHREPRRVGAGEAAQGFVKEGGESQRQRLPVEGASGGRGGLENVAPVVPAFLSGAAMLSALRASE